MFLRSCRRRPVATVKPEELLEFLRPRLAHFMIPRYVRVVAELLRTPTQKIEKYVLRQEDVTPDTWDREKAGIRIKREKLAHQVSNTTEANERSGI